jgi:hypothetical protein
MNEVTNGNTFFRLYFNIKLKKKHIRKKFRMYGYSAAFNLNEENKRNKRR